jgi:hypothetical protein
MNDVLQKERIPLFRSNAYGFEWDFNEGCRVYIPPGKWRVRLIDERFDISDFGFHW